jgi:hypothetical protein
MTKRDPEVCCPGDNCKRRMAIRPSLNSEADWLSSRDNGNGGRSTLLLHPLSVRLAASTRRHDARPTKALKGCDGRR